ncbi:hypothetical protein C8R43DRAFT_965339 [Mycena crocata]|nr:hypothetical protein C8R43DRAFT_965339 [Mycena crocata]
MGKKDGVDVSTVPVDISAVKKKRMDASTWWWIHPRWINKENGYIQRGVDTSRCGYIQREVDRSMVKTNEKWMCPQGKKRERWICPGSSIGQVVVYRARWVNIHQAVVYRARRANIHQVVVYRAGEYSPGGGISSKAGEYSPGGGISSQVGEYSPGGGIPSKAGEYSPGGGISSQAVVYRARRANIHQAVVYRAGEYSPGGGMPSQAGEYSPGGGISSEAGEYSPGGGISSEAGEYSPGGGISSEAGEYSPGGGIPSKAGEYSPGGTHQKGPRNPQNDLILLPTDTLTRVPSGPGPQRKTSSSWQELLNTASTDETQLLWAYSLSSSGPSPDLSSSSFCESSGIWANLLQGIHFVEGDLGVKLPPCTYQTQAERYLMNQLSIQPPDRDLGWWLNFTASHVHKRDGDDVSGTNIMLHDLENALENYAAAFFWSLAYLRNSPRFQSIQVVGPGLVSELQLDVLPVAAGLILSIFLLLLSPILVGLGPPATKREEGTHLDTLGVLETTWLVGARGAVSDVVEPSTKHLRAAGMAVETSFYGRWRAEKHPLQRRSSSATMLIGHGEEGSVASARERETD